MWCKKRETTRGSLSALATVAVAAIAFMSGMAAAADPYYDIDVWFNVTMQNLSSTKVNITGLNQTALVEKLNTLASGPNPGIYANFINSVVTALLETGGTVEVSACFAGSYTDPLSGICVPCPAGKYSNVTNAVSADVCQSCPPGTYSTSVGANSDAVCTKCPVGTYSSALGASALSQCQACPDKATTVGGGGAQTVSSCICQDGYYTSRDDGSCALCPVGYYCYGGTGYECFQHDAVPPISSSPQGSKSKSDCFCQAGYYGVPVDRSSYCQECPAGTLTESYYCPGILVDGVAQKYSCPANSVTVGPKAKSIADCKCAASYRTQLSDYAVRRFRVDATRCICNVSDGSQCSADASGCSLDSCEKAGTCVPNALGTGKLLTCPQGYVNLVLENGNYGAATAALKWTIAPTGAQAVTLKFSSFNTLVGDNLTISQCKWANCSVSEVVKTLSGDLSGSKLPSVSTAVGWPVMRLSWLTGATSSGYGWRATYGSIMSCVDSTIPLTPTQIQYKGTRAVEGYVAPVGLSFPLVAWLGDTVGLDMPVYVTSFATPGGVPLDVTPYVPVDVRYSPSESGQSALGSGGIKNWIPPSMGVYYVVDPSMPSTRYRKIFVLPLEPSKRVLYYTVENPNGIGATFTLTGGDGMSGTQSPDIVLTVGDTLVMSRLTDSYGVMLLKSFTPGTTPTWELVTNGVSGQSSPVEMVSSLTWDTSTSDAGVYYYASAQQTGKVGVGRVLLTARPGGRQCIQCSQGEYCYDGNPLRCPAYSTSPPGSTREEDCTCVSGHAREMTDMGSYVNSQAVDSGGRHSCVVTHGDGGLWCWGANEAYQLGLGRTSAYEAVPQRVNVTGVTQVALGDDFTCVVLAVGADLRTRCWGSNYYGQLGLDSDNMHSGATEPSKLADARLGSGSTAYTTRYLSCGWKSCCAIVYRLSQLAMTCWGLGDTGQLGRGDSKTGNIGTVVTGKLPNDPRYSYAVMGSDLSLVPIGVLTQPTAVTMGGAHACALFQDGGGSVLCWGKNSYGALGIGKADESSFFSPTPVNLGPGNLAKTVNCYNFVCCAVILGTFDVKCWGMGAGGRLGVSVFNVGTSDSSMGANLQSVQLGTAQYAMDVNVGSTQVCALLGNNFVKCWGLVAGLVLGDNPPLDMYDLLPSLNMSGGRVALQISGKSASTCAVLSDYKVACWGNNDYKQLGGTPVKDATSVPLVNMTMANLSAGVEALHSSGTPQSLVCSLCAANYYCDGGGGVAASCPSSTVSFAASTSPDDCKCLQGYTPLGDGTSACRVCTGPEWCVNGQSNPCPAFSSTLADGAQDVAQCACLPGYTGVNGGVCTACAAGTYKDASGGAACTPCPFGTYSSVVGLNRSQGCLPCKAGTFSASASGAIECQVCGPGKAAKTGSSACVSCGAGFFATDSSEGCLSCPPGTYDDAPYEGSVGTCTNCSKGTASPALNATSVDTCKWCPAGTKAPEGASSCVSCAAGEYSNGGTELCTACPNNSYSLGGTGLSGCACVAGFYKKMGTDGRTFECTRCLGGQWAGANASACTLCPSGTASSAEGATTGGVCASCGKGSFAAAGSTGCGVCPIWTYTAADGQGSCQNCSLGEWAAAGSSVCSSCVAGKYSMAPIGSSGSCSGCPRGSFCVGSVDSKLYGLPQVQLCPAGSFVPEGTVELREAGQCGDCYAGSFCPMPTMMTRCPLGTSSPARSSSQLQCTCEQGYVCSYTKLINAVVHLQMSLSQFSDVGVQNAFKEAVAQASKTTAGNVRIIKFFEAPRAAVGGSRRLLGVDDGLDELLFGAEQDMGSSSLSLARDASSSSLERGRGLDDLFEGGGAADRGSAVEKRGVGVEADGGLHVFLEVQGGGDDLEGLDLKLVGAGLEPSLDHAWYSPHMVSARREDS